MVNGQWSMVNGNAWIKFHFASRIPIIFKLSNLYCPVNYFEWTGLRKMALRKLAYEALKEKHHVPKSALAIRSKVALMLGFIQLMELVFLSRGRQFLVIFLQP